MRLFARERALASPVGPVDVARWEQYDLDDALPFQAMWYTVAPQSSPPPDCHPEFELSLVISGVASVEVGDTITEVVAGSSFLLDSGERHVIHNRSSEQPLVVFSAYWMPPTEG